MDSKLLVGLIKEVVKNEVKQQVKEELAKLIKSGAVTLNKERKETKPSLLQMTEVKPIAEQARPRQAINKPKKVYVNNPMLNEVLNQTQPFNALHYSEGGMMNENSVLDMMQPEKYEEDGWETMDYREIHDIPQNMPNFQSTGDSLQDATLKALTRDYSALTKVFAKQEQEKKGR